MNILHVAMAVVRKSFKSLELGAVERGDRLRDCSEQGLLRRWAKFIDVRSEFVSVFEVKFVLAGFFGWASGHETFIFGFFNISVPNCSSTRIPALSRGTPAAMAFLKPSKMIIFVGGNFLSFLLGRGCGL